MLGGRFFNNIWDPYSVAYSYPRPQYYRPRADHYEVPQDRSNEQPLNEKTVKMVKTIPVTDGGALDLKPVAKSEDAAASEIQAFYRGYVVRKTQPLEHLKVIKKVKEELESLKFKLQEAEQKVKLRSDTKERLRWTEGVMALLLRLDSLQGVHPAVRLIRKAVTKELIGFQETIDSMSTVSAETNDVISHETNGSSAAPASEVVEEMETEGNISRDVVQDSTPAGATENGSDGLAVKSNEDLFPEKHVPHAPLASNYHVIDSVVPRCDENGLLVSESMVEVEEPSASEALLEDPMDAENKEQLLKMSPASDMEEDEPASSLSLPPETGNQEAEVDMSQSGVNGENPTLLEEIETTTGLDGRIIPARISTQSMALEPQCKQDDKQNNMDALSDRALLLQVLEENRKLKDVLGKVLEWGKLQSDSIHNLTQRISQLEEHQPPSTKLLHGKDRKRVRSVDNMERSRRRSEKGRRNRCQHGYLDSEDWHSVESDDYF